MVAKRDGAQTGLMAQLKARRIKKTYLALVLGHRRRPPSGGSRRRSGATRASARGWRSSPTGGRRSPATGSASGSTAGRCSSSTSSPAGPTRSGSTSTRSATRSPATRSTGRARRARGPTGLERLFLHAWRLELASPTDGHLIRAEAPLPPALESVLRRARARRAGGAMTSEAPVPAAPAGRCSSSSRARAGVGQGHDHRRAAPPAARSRLPLRRDLHDPGAAAGRGRRRQLPLPRSPSGSWRCATRASCSRRTEVHGDNWYGTPRDEVRRGARGRPRRDPQDRRPGRPAGQGARRRRAPHLHRPAVHGGAVRAAADRATESADELAVRQRDAAIELARQDDYDYVVVNETGQVERTAARIDEIIANERRLHPDRRVRRLGAIGRRSDAARASGRCDNGRVILDPVLEPLDAVPPGARLVEVAIDAAGGAGGPDVHVPVRRTTWPTSWPATRSSSSSGGGRRSGSVVGDAAPEPDPSLARPTKPMLARVRSDGPLLPALSRRARPLDRRPLPRAARPSSSGRCSRRACSSASSSSPTPSARTARPTPRARDAAGST